MLYAPHILHEYSAHFRITHHSNHILSGPQITGGDHETVKTKSGLQESNSHKDPGRKPCCEEDLLQ